MDKHNLKEFSGTKDGNRLVVVVGGGASGLMAAGQASALGAETLLLEKMDHPGLKLRITGKGRCNITNIAEMEEFIAHFGPNGIFLRQAFARFFSADLLDFFLSLNVRTIQERGGRVFPEGGARELVQALLDWVKKSGVRIQTGCRAIRLERRGGQVSGVVLGERGGGERLVPAASVVLAAGGSSYPGTGSTGDGFRMALESSHALSEIRPALVPVETAGDFSRRLQGLSLKNVMLRLWVDGKAEAELFGEMLFTHFGVSGPIVLSLSRAAGDALRKGRKAVLSIDLKPALDAGKLDKRILREIESHGKRNLRNMLKTLLPASLIPVCLESVGLTPEHWSHQMTAEERRRLGAWIKDFRLTVSGVRSWDEAIVTAGGVSLKEVDPRTMASRILRGLYIAGEVLDLDADTGGYNLQAAFSTGWLAGRSAAAFALSRDRMPDDLKNTGG